MRFRTKLFFTSSLVVLLLWVGTLWPIQYLIWSNCDHLANSSFAGTRQGLRSLQAEHISRMRQVGRMLMEIPELRALIAEHNFEVSPDNLASLRERLDNLSEVMGAPFVCVCDARGVLVAQNSTAPWTTLTDLREYLAHSPQAQPLVHRLYVAPSGSSRANAGEYGLWPYHGQVFQVVGLPLVFDADQSTVKADGALIMASPITAVLAEDLASSHDCEITFLTAEGGAATSLAPALVEELRRAYDRHLWPSSATFDTTLGGTRYRSYCEPLIDPCSGAAVGATVIQSSMADWIVLQRKISRSLLAIMSAGLLVAASASFVLSGAITRPVRELVKGARRVAEGDLNSTIVNRHRDEFGELATAFNDMVAQLRARRELERLVEQSQAASKAKSQFLANMSHEIRTPLHGVIGMVNLLLGTSLTERQQHYATLVRSSTEVLATLINDLLDFSKIEAGKLELETVEFDLHAVVEDVVELLYQKAIQKGVEIACEIEPDVPRTVNGDATRLRQILLNLVGNAVKFTQAGEIIVHVMREMALSDALGLRFGVIDSGIGIPPDRLDRLFNSFSQVDASTTRRFGGTGLGLAICKQLAELMGGQVGVKSEYGKGSTFWFTANFQAATGVEPEANPSLAGIRVLVAEANSSVRAILARQLRSAGIDAREGGTGTEIEQLIAAAESVQKRFQFALVSRTVPGFASVVEAVRSRNITPVLLATTANDERPEVLHEAGFVSALAKPVRRSRLLAVLAGPPGDLGRDTQEHRTPPGNPSPFHRSDRPIRVLVAEDNEINQIVAAEFLRKLGFEIHIVNDGKSAVEALIKGHYDLVLMDCQMPIMDGFEATREIRRHEQASTALGKPAPKVPIIALTANASGADRGRCLEAGMNAYCGKPFREKELLETFALFLPTARPPAPPPTAPPAKTEGPSREDVPFSLSALRDRCSGNAALALTILTKFEKQLGEAGVQIEVSLRERNGEQVARVSHAMKGTAGVLAAESLRLALAELEQHGRRQTLDLAEASYARLREEIARCTAYVSRARSDLHADSANNGR